MSDLKDSNEAKSSKLQIWGGAIIVLMIVLMLIPANIGGRLPHERGHDVLIGTMSSGHKITAADRFRALQILETLGTLYLLDGENPVPLLGAVWGEKIVQDFKSHPEALAMLLVESQRVSPGVNPYVLGEADPARQSDTLRGIFNAGWVSSGDLHPLPNSLLGEHQTRLMQRALVLREPLQDFPVMIGVSVRGSLLPPRRLPPNEQAALYRAMADFLTIQSAASLTLNAIKVTTPIVDRDIATNLQTFTLQLAAFDARLHELGAGEPDEAQLKEQFAKYAATPRGDLNANPFGFGYRVPNRVAVELISFRRQDVRAVVVAEKTDYQWEVDARYDFHTNPEKYAALTTPASAQTPTTGPTTAPADPPTPLSFDQVKDAAISQFIESATDSRMADIDRRMRSTMAPDFQAWNASRNTKVNAGNSSLGVAYDSPDYLPRLAADIAARFKVRPAVDNDRSWLRDRGGLLLLSDLSEAIFPLPRNLPFFGQATQLRGPDYALAFAKDLLTEEQAIAFGEFALDRFEPSDRLTIGRDPQHPDAIVYLRLAEVSPNHPATDLAAVRDQVRADWKRAEAQRLAVRQATLAADVIRQTGEFNPPGATISTVEIASWDVPPAGLSLSRASLSQLRQEVSGKLLGGEAQPVAVLDVPDAHVAYAARRVALKANWTSADDLSAERDATRVYAQLLMTSLKSSGHTFALTANDPMADWFNVKQIETRNGWTPAAPDPDSGAAPPSATEPAAR